MARAARKIPEGAWPRLLSAERAAAYLDISLGTFNTIVAPHFPPTRIASRKLWDRTMLDRWLDEQQSEQPEHDWLRAFDK
jgi:hypothetical protein